MKGLIIRGFGELYEVMCDDGTFVKCTVRSTLKKKDLIPLVGDTAEFEPQARGHAAIVGIDERKNSLIRPPLANVDKLFIVSATYSPAPSYATIDKICCAAVAKGISPVLVFNKTDLKDASEIREIYSKTGIPIYEVCATDGVGIRELKKEISGICAFAGPSGVGKSSLMNALFPELSLEVGNVSEKNLRGKHTTRRVELFKVDGGYFADTPGFALLDFEHFDFLTLEELPYSFPEFERYLGKCRYTSCTHTKEEDCAIVSAVKNGEISKSRHENYLEMYETLKNKKTYK